jgi:hypothetical protein
MLVVCRDEPDHDFLAARRFLTRTVTVSRQEPAMEYWEMFRTVLFAE